MHFHLASDAAVAHTAQASVHQLTGVFDFAEQYVLAPCVTWRQIIRFGGLLPHLLRLYLARPRPVGPSR